MVVPLAAWARSVPFQMSTAKDSTCWPRVMSSPSLIRSKVRCVGGGGEFADGHGGRRAGVGQQQVGDLACLRPDFLAVRHSQLLVLDGLYLGLAQRAYDRTTELLETTAAAISDHHLIHSARRAVQQVNRTTAHPAGETN
jgi:hypothetical protein